MLDYFKYTVSAVILLAAAYGIWIGDQYVWLGLGVLVGVLGFDAFLPPDHSERDQRYPWLYDAIISFNLALGFGLVFLYAHLVGSDHFTTTSSAVGAFLSMMFVQFVVTAPALHELFHRENLLLRTYGRFGLVLIFDPWREITHVVTHHMRVGTPDDPDYARRGDTVYGHLLRTFKGQIVESYHLERAMWTKRGRRWYDPRNGWVQRAATLVVFVAALLAVGGPKGAAMVVAVCLAGPRLFLEVFNYTQHYGLVTGTPGRFEKRHTWNHLTPFVRLLALEITNHTGHHEDSYKPFYGLVPDPTGPKQPQFLLCVMLAFVPPLWFMMIKPLLKDWDERYANQQEREIARAENARAGWHDLNDDDAIVPGGAYAAAR
ncbi:fatty acid desaturase [Hydrocarboniphaga sp.]|uniref:fatty acid desaturase n=1 Tax=Hydrocarboniphaga sp. TaxID=2033016 RepID=UPI003D0EE43C